MSFRPSITVPQGGASLMIAFRCNRKSLLVIGHDEIAANRVLLALEADAQVALVGSTASMCDELLYRIQEGQVEWLGEHFDEEQLIGHHLVFVTSEDIALCRTISNACCARRIPVNIANMKELSDFDMTCSYRDQSLQVAVSTNGLSSVNLANRILKSKISTALSTDLGEAVKNVGILRRRVEALDPGVSSSAVRYQWISHICEYSSLQRLANLSTADMSAMLKTYVDFQQKQERLNQFSASSPITFVVGNEAMDVETQQLLAKADLVIVDPDLTMSYPHQTASENITELNKMGLVALEGGNRVVRMISNILDSHNEEMFFYRSHGYIPLFVSGEFIAGPHS